MGTNAHFQEITLAYSHSKGLYVSFSLSGMTLSPDKKMNEEIYGTDFDIKSILNTPVDPDNAEEETVKLAKALSKVDDAANKLADE